MISMRMLPPLLFGTSICNENTTISCYFMSTSLQIISRRHHHLVRRRGMDGGYSNDHNPCDHPRLLLLCHSQRQYSNDAFIRFLAVMSFSSFSCCCCCCCCCPCCCDAPMEPSWSFVLLDSRSLLTSIATTKLDEQGGGDILIG